MKASRVFDLVYLGVMGTLTLFAAVVGLLWVMELIPPADWTVSQLFGFWLILAAWALSTMGIRTRRKGDGDAR